MLDQAVPGCHLENLCDDHIKLPYFQRTADGWKWLIRNNTGNGKHCHCGSHATWLLVVSDE